ncbi:MAG: M14 family zinc carboxypeptidase [Actinomycetota bacterium]
MTNSRWTRAFLLILLVVLVAALGLPADAAKGKGKKGGKGTGGKKGFRGARNMYEVVVEATTARALVQEGLDIVEIESAGEGLIKLTMVLYPAQRIALEKKSVDVALSRDRRGRTARQLARLQALQGYNVWRSWDEPGGIEDEIRRIARRHPGLVKLVDLGDSHQGRDILALKLTRNAKNVPDGSRPAVLYTSLQHAREWISVEVNRRLLHRWIDRFKDGNTAIRNLLTTTELWFVLVANPDGYEYTFDHDRLWRKNLRDNDANGIINNFDGVDPNRNFPEHWNYDDEGSSSLLTSETYRGPAPASEPETQALIDLFNRVPFRFLVNYHSFGELLLYPQGWQDQTPTADDPIYLALTGTDDAPAIPNFDPDLSSDLYVTNGETTDWAHGERGALAWTPELGEGRPGAGFVFPDKEGLIRKHTGENRQFALNVAMSAADPDDPKSHWGIDTKPFYLETASIDSTRNQNPLSDFRFPYSYGDPQPVRVLAKRSLGPVTVHWSVNGGAEQTAPTSEWDGGERFGGDYDTHYRYMEGQVSGFDVGNQVEVWFTGGGEESDHFTFEVRETAPAQVLILAAEDYTGPTNDPPYASTTSLNYVQQFTDALDANGISHDVYDVDGTNRTAPSHLGVLSHYDGVIWYTGNDFLTREPGQPPGTGTSALANQEMLQVRSYLNEGGKLLYNGQWAGLQYVSQFDYNRSGTPNPLPPPALEFCDNVDQTVDDDCDFHFDDFLQYWLGAYLYVDGGGTDDVGNPFPVQGLEDPFTGADLTLNGGTGADNQVHTASFLTTSSILKPADYPQFSSDAPAVWETGVAGPYQPHGPVQYMYSDRADISYKRLLRPLDLTSLSPGSPASLSFFTSYDTEPFWDHVFVEVHTAGQNDWTTLPDANGHTTQDTGDSCPAGWHDIHPFLAHYQTLNADGSCSPTGSTGDWHASSGRSAGWEEWEVDLSAYSGSQIEVSITYVSDWAIQGVGAFVDDITVSTGEGSTGFEAGLDGWTIPGSPEDPGEPDTNYNPNDWFQTTDVGFEEGAVVSTEDTLYFGFGFEGITDEADRNDVMCRSMAYLIGTPCPPGGAA